MNYGYIRVSSDKQSVENQRFEIAHYCEHNHIQIDLLLIHEEALFRHRFMIIMAMVAPLLMDTA